MKKVHLLLLALTAPFVMFAQQGINYQAVVRDGGGAVMLNQAVAVDFEVIQGSSNGPVVYSESHNLTTNDYGLINVVIGEGTVNSGDFSTIDWASDIHFLGITIDGNNLGTIEFKAVPYSLHSHFADSIPNVTPNTVDSDVEVTSTDGHAVLGIYPETSNIDDSSSIFLGEGANHTYGMSINYDGANNLFHIGGMANGTVYGPHLTIERTSGNSSFSKGLEIQETTSTPAPNKTYGNSGPLAYGVISGGGLINTDYGITSASNPSAGVYTIVLDNAWSGIPAVVVTTLNLSSDTEIATYSTSGSNTITVRVVDENNLPVASQFSFVVYGTPQ